MRAVIQRVKSAEVYVDGRLSGKIGNGLLVFVGVAKGDGEEDISYMTSKLPDLRIFEDASGKFNLSLKEIEGRDIDRLPVHPLRRLQKGKKAFFYRGRRTGCCQKSL